MADQKVDEIVARILGELKGTWRYRWHGIALAWAVCLVGWAAVFTIPNVYESEAVVYIDTNSVLNPLLGNLTITNDIRDRVNYVTAAMLGRPQLAAVAEKVGLDRKAESPRELNDVLLGLYNRTRISERGGRQQSVYTISYKDRDPEMAQRVVETMLTTFVDDTMVSNRLDTENAQNFIREQLANLEKELTAAEQRLADFKKANVGRMPGEGGGYFARLQTEMTRLEQVRSELRQVQRRKDTLEVQLSGERGLSQLAATGVQTELDQQIADNQTRLAELRLRFTDRHPEVIAVMETLDQLRQRKAGELEQLQSSTGSIVPSENPVYQNIQIELSNANVQIAELRERESMVEAEIARFRDLMDVLPEVEAELARLTRDYDVKQSQYQDLLRRLNVAELSQEADRSTDIKFQVIDPPRVPFTPSEPNRALLLAGVLLLALGAGGGGAFLLNLLKPVFHDSRSLMQIAGYPVLAAIAAFPHPDRTLTQTRQVGTFAGAVLLLVGAFVAVFFLEPVFTGVVQRVL